MRDIIVTSTILIIVLLILRHLAKGKIHPLLQYALWLLVVFRLTLPIPLWNSPFSVLNLLPNEQAYVGNGASTAGVPNADKANTANGQDTDGADAASGRNINSANSADTANGQNADSTNSVNGQSIDNENAANGQSADSANSADIANRQNADTAANGTDIKNRQLEAADIADIGNAAELPAFAQGGYRIQDIMRQTGIIWILGAAAVGGYMLFYQIRWKQYVRKNRQPLKGNRKYHERLSVYTVKGLPSPCLTGRNIYLTKEMAADKKKLEHILAHEYCHYRHLDSIWVIVRCVLTAVYWFHPLVWVAAYVSKQDSELACDMAAIRMLGEKERLAYGKTLLQLISKEPCDRSRIGIASTMSGGEKGIRERIFLIARKPKYFAAAAGIVVLLAAALAAVTFTGQKQENSVKMTEQQSAGLSENEPEQQFDKDLQKQQETARQNEAEQQKQLQEQEKEQMTENDSEAVLKKLSSYDSEIVSAADETGGQGNAVKLPSDYVQAYYEKGEDALPEGIYLLKERKGENASDIKIYGMYTKEFGFRGIRIFIGDDCNDYDDTWILSYLDGQEGTVSLYEQAEDGMPRTFAYKMLAVNTSDSEVWKLYLGDRYDTGTVELAEFSAKEYMPMIQERLRFEIEESGKGIIVYDKEEKIGEIERDTGALKAVKEVKDVVVDGSIIGWELGESEKELRLIAAPGLELETGIIWYPGMPLISFPVECGYFGERAFSLGQAKVESGYQNAMVQTMPDADSTIGNAQSIEPAGDTANAEVTYINPCPSYTRISDSFGTRTHPITGEKRKHEGVDLAAEKGADIVAAADGIVDKTGYDAESGNYIILYHAANNEYTHYAACNEIFVSKGDAVTKGQKIATVGQTGRSTGAHLHFAVSRDGTYIEPIFE